MTKITISIMNELNLAKFTLFLLDDRKVDLPQIDGEFTVDLVPGTYDVSVSSKGNEEGKKATFTFKTDAGKIKKSVRAGKTGKVAGFVQFTLDSGGGVSA